MISSLNQSIPTKVGALFEQGNAMTSTYSQTNLLIKQAKANDRALQLGTASLAFVCFGLFTSLLSYHIATVVFLGLSLFLLSRAATQYKKSSREVKWVFRLFLLCNLLSIALAVYITTMEDNYYTHDPCAFESTCHDDP